ncbi:MAG: histidine triad nucleotide-binding protein [Desulfobacteraceae bacterium]
MEESCIFCKIIEGRKTADKVYQDDHLVAFHDIKPHAPVHILLVPRKHIRSINDLEKEDRALLGEMLFRAREIARDQGIHQSGYRLVFNVERGGGQYVFHLHLHLMGGW